MQYMLLTGSIKQIKVIVCILWCLPISMLIMLTKLITTGLIGHLYLLDQLLSKLFLLKLQDIIEDALKLMHHITKLHAQRIQKVAVC
jgi:hypothetical protein